MEHKKPILASRTGFDGSPLSILDSRLSAHELPIPNHAIVLFVDPVGFEPTTKRL